MTRSLHTGMGTALLAFCALIVSAPHARADQYQVPASPPSTQVPANSSPSQNTISTIRNSDSEVWGAVGLSLFNYQEQFYPPNIPDSEHGWTPSISAGLDYMTNNNWYYAIETNAVFGSDHYNGSLYDSNTNTYDIPYQGTTDETIIDTDGKIGRGFALGQKVMLTPYAELGFRYWDRNLGGGQDEVYQNFDMLGGLMLQYAPTTRWILTAYGSAGTTLDAQMATMGQTFDLGDYGMYKFGGKVALNLSKNWELFTALDYEAFRYMQSPTLFTATSAAYEPSSKTEETTMRVGLGYHFR